MILCLELFTIGTSTVPFVIHDTCHVFNVVLGHISWPTGIKCCKRLCGLHVIVGGALIEHAI